MTPAAKNGRRLQRPFWLSAWLSLFSLGLAAMPAEYQVKAVFLYNFSQYVTWPETAFSSPRAPFRLCILGQDPFGFLLDITVEQQSSEGRTIELQRLEKLRQAESCQILYLDTAEAARSDALLDWARDRPILTISDLNGFAARGGSVELRRKQGRIQLLINRRSLRASGLTAHPNLLRLAELLGDEP